MEIPGSKVGEVWEWVVGFEGRYKVSTLGRVYSVSRERVCGWSGSRPQVMPGRMMKMRVSNKGYMRVALCKGSKGSLHTVHWLVAEVFVPNVDNKPWINHKDCNKRNNRPDNLEWVTSQENTAHAIENELVKWRRGSEMVNAKLDEVAVKKIKLLLGMGRTGRLIAKEFDVSFSTVSLIKRGLTWRHVI